MIKKAAHKTKYVSNWRDHIPDLQNIFLAGIDFSNQDLSDCCFDGAILSGANFEGANLENASFNKCLLSDANFGKANLKRTNFTNALLVRVNFLNSDLTGSDFTDANLESVSYPFNCKGFLGVKHSMDNIQKLLTLFKLLREVDHDLLEALKPWFDDTMSLRDQVNGELFKNDSVHDLP